MKRISNYIFITLIGVSICLAIISLQNKEWESVTAAVSLIIAIISGWIAYETFYRQSQANKPQIIVRLDFKSRYDLILLVVENLGNKPAFNITIQWDQELLNLDGEKISFNQYDHSVDIPVLNTNESTSVIVDLASRFYQRDKNQNLDYSGIITFQESLNSRKTTSYPFQFSFKHYGNSPSFENEESSTMFELQKIPDKLEKIRNELRNINDKLNKPRV